MLVTRGLGKKQTQQGALLTTLGLGRTYDSGVPPEEPPKTGQWITRARRRRDR